MDANSDGRVSEDEFVKACLNQESISKMLILKAIGIFVGKDWIVLAIYSKNCDQKTQMALYFFCIFLRILIICSSDKISTNIVNAIFALYFIVLLFNLSDRNLFGEAEGSEILHELQYSLFLIWYSDFPILD